MDSDDELEDEEEQAEWQVTFPFILFHTLYIEIDFQFY